MSSESLKHNESKGVLHTVDIRIRAIYESYYLNIISATFKGLKLPQLIERLVPVDSLPLFSQSCSMAAHSGYLKRSSSLGSLGTIGALDLFAETDPPGVRASQFNDDAIGRHLDRLYDANVHQAISACLVEIDKEEVTPFFVRSMLIQRTRPFMARMNRQRRTSCRSRRMTTTSITIGKSRSSSD
jgi:hypothetical protein